MTTKNIYTELANKRKQAQAELQHLVSQLSCVEKAIGHKRREIQLLEYQMNVKPNKGSTIKQLIDEQNARAKNKIDNLFAERVVVNE